MKPHQIDPHHLARAITAGKIVAEVTQGRTYDSYVADRMLSLATDKAVETMAEAMFQLTKQFKARFDGLDWYAVAGLRHELVHDYGYLPKTRLWYAATIQVPEWLAYLEAAALELYGPEFFAEDDS